MRSKSASSNPLASLRLTRHQRIVAENELGRWNIRDTLAKSTSLRKDSQTRNTAALPIIWAHPLLTEATIGLFGVESCVNCEYSLPDFFV